jgi:hypothetical protein
MNVAVLKRFALAGMALGVIFGCNSVSNDIVDEGTTGGGDGTTDFAQVESTFSDAPISPGGTGGLATEEPEPVNDQAGEVTRSFFTAYQIDPEAEDSAGPKFVVAGDVDHDGLLDLVSGWNQSQPVQIHLQQRDDDDNILFRTITLAGTTPVAVIAGVELGQVNDDNGDGLINNDDWLDIVVLSKATGFVTLCPPVQEGDDPKVIGALDGEILAYFSPGSAAQIADGDLWTEMNLINPFVADPWIYNQFPGNEEVDFDESKTKPEWSGFTSLVVANVDGVPGDDILVALNPATCKTLGQEPPTNTVDLWTNPGPGFAQSSSLWGAPPLGGQSRNVPITLISDAPPVKDIAVMDIDSDGDLDVIATYTNSISLNVRWARNPLVAHRPGGPDGYAAVIAGSSGPWHYWASGWEERPVGQIDTAADVLALGDVDNDGFEDIVVRSTIGQIVQWFRRPNPLVVEPEFPPNDPVPNRFNFPWPVFTLTEFEGQEPEAVAVGDVTGDGAVNLAIAAEGAVFWYESQKVNGASAPYDPWLPNTIIQDNPPDATDPSQAGPAPPTTPGAGVGVTAVDTSTHINSLLIIDLDGDGKRDIIGTLDRRTGAGLSDDRLVWYRNTKSEDEE